MLYFFLDIGSTPSLKNPSSSAVVVTSNISWELDAAGVDAEEVSDAEGAEDSLGDDEAVDEVFPEQAKSERTMRIAKKTEIAFFIFFLLILLNNSTYCCCLLVWSSCDNIKQVLALILKK
jgi:hypothetical protein